ncbi:hypothetical protein DRH14_01105 [Candidatus Shapirobacteria bacterium]|nr:MAG: hypothetical protein DRH14_01105 [Candidatus Shapirobacteria bacterium]
MDLLNQNPQPTLSPTPNQTPPNKTTTFLFGGLVLLLLSFIIYQQYQIKSLSSRQSSVSTTTDTTPTIASVLPTTAPLLPTPTPDTRILLTPDNIQQYNQPYDQACDVQFNYDPPTTTVTYVDSDKGLSIEIPNNPNWGNDQYRINAYDENLATQKDVIVQFGPIGPFEGCTWTRLDTILFEPAKTIKQTEVSLRSDLGPNTTSSSSLRQITLTNGLTAFEYIDEGIGRIYTIEVVGKKYNYRISLWPKTDDTSKEFALVESIANTIKLID